MSELEEVLTAVRAEHGDHSRFPAVGFERRQGLIRVWFGAGWEAAVRALAERFGVLVTATAGFGGNGDASSPDVPPATAEVSHEALAFTCHSSESPIHRHQGGTAQIRVENHADSHATVVISADIALITDPATGLIVGSHHGWVVGTTDVLRLTPGATSVLNVLVGTDSSQGPNHESAPPGRYDLVAPVSLTPYPPTYGPLASRWVLARGSVELV